ncbi:MAG TPA: DUF1016 N-terminal domain-containing protein [Bryobacteraceae bacterium]|nr:DUF1016 N-terminal domain-containing protein [Bryobacteraceae bacterium]
MKKKSNEQLSEVVYEALLSDLVSLLDRARRASARAVNHVITSTYWEIGRRIVEHEQKGSRRAEYGEQLIKQLARDLTERLGRGFSQSNVFQMRQFFLTHREKFQTVSGKSASPEKFQTPSGKSQTLPVFPLSWSHYVRLLSLRSDQARQFYEEEASRGGWSVRQLDRQIATQFYVL